MGGKHLTPWTRLNPVRPSLHRISRFAWITRGGRPGLRVRGPPIHGALVSQRRIERLEIDGEFPVRFTTLTQCYGGNTQH